MSCSVFARASRGFLAVALAAACVPCAAFADDATSGLGGEGGAPAAASTSDVTVDSAALAALVDNLTARLAVGGDYSNLVSVVEGDGYSYASAVYADAAVALYQQGKGSLIDLSSLKENYSLLSSAGQLAKAAIIFKAAGVDPSAVEIDGVTHDVIAEMESAFYVDGAVSASIYDLVYILPVYKFSGTVLSDSAATQLIEAILAAQVTDAADNCSGLFGTVSEWNGTIYDSHGVQTSAQAILALAPYASRSDVAAAIANATTAIDKLQNSDGSFNDGYSSYSASIDSTAAAVVAYAALGKDVQAACAFLVSESAGSNYAGYDNSALSWDPSYTAPTALMGLVAYERAAEMGGTYNMFGAYIEPPATPAPSLTPEEAVAESDTAAADAAASDDALAPTGDAAGIAGACAAAGALGAGVVAAAALARARRRVA